MKPENLLYQSNDISDPILKIADFGFAKAKDQGEVFTTICGSPNFIGKPELIAAPEIISEQSYTVQVDCWSLGVIIYYILSGTFPFFAEGIDSLFELIKKGEFEFSNEIWDEISSEAKDLIQKLLVVDPAKRLETSEISEHPWFTKNT